MFTRRLCSTLLTGALLAVGAPAAAQQSTSAEAVAEDDLRPAFRATGSFFSRYEVRRGYAQGPVLADDPGSDLVRYRARLGLHVDRLSIEPTIGVHFVPQAGGFWHVGGNDLADPSLGVHEGWVDITAGNVRFDVGRFEMTYGEHLVIGNVGWHHIGRAFNGVRSHITLGDAWVDLFATVLDEGFVSGPFAEPFGAGDAYFLGAYAGLGGLLWDGLDLDVYVLSRVWPGIQDLPPDPERDPAVMERDPASDVTPGVRVKGKAGVFDYRAEQGVQLGTRPDVDGEAPDVFAYQGDLELGLDFRRTAHVRVAAEAFYASGDDPGTETVEAWDHLYPTAHKWMGLMDVVGARSNVYGGVFHLQAAFAPVSASLDAHAFWRPEPFADADPYVGTELDAGVAWAIAEPLKLRGLYGLFIPTETDPLHFVELSLRATF